MRRVWLQRRRVATILCLYTALYVGLDRVSLVGVLPNVGFTLWNPPPASSLALLLFEGFRFAPALFPAAMIADGVNGGFAVGLAPTIVMDIIIALGYTVIAFAVHRFTQPPLGLLYVRCVITLLAIVCLGVLAIAGSVSGVLVMLGALQPREFLVAVRHFWIGDVTGIVGLFPVLLLAQAARSRWRELPVRIRLQDLAVFAVTLSSGLWIVFGVGSPKEFQFFYLLLLPIIWIGVRHGLPWCSVAILVEQLALVTVVTLRGYPASDLTDFQFLSLALAFTGLIVGALVSERQQSELRLQRQQVELGRMTRVTTAGALGGAILHEITQPLATVATYANACRRLLQTEPQQPVVLAATLAKVETEIMRIGTIVDRLRDFLVKGEPRRACLDLADMVGVVVLALADEARLHGVEVCFDPESPGVIAVDRLQVEQVLLNLIRNAIEATSNHPAGDRHIWIRLRRAGADIQLDVEDNGTGVPAAIAPDLFKPFTTGKSTGLGLGLFLSREIILFHGGDLWFDRAVTTGARFAFRLPCVDAA